MPYAASTGVQLYFEEAGSGTPLIFVHEFAGDCRSWETQMRFFARRYRCIAFNARGYPPSSVPDDPADYAQDRQADDIGAVLDTLGIARAHVVGLSMGAFATLHFGLRHPARASAMVLAGIGSGSSPHLRSQFQADSRAAADRFEQDGAAVMAQAMGVSPTRIQLHNKDPRGWAEATAHLASHPPRGAANTLRGYQATRPALHDLAVPLAASAIPALIVIGDEDEPCVDTGLWLKRTMPMAGLAMLARTGHCVNLEEPDAFNRLVLDFLTLVEQGKWTARDGAARGSASFGPSGR